MLRLASHILLALPTLAGLVLRARGGMAGRYWQWRLETAGGPHDRRPGRPATLRAAADYAAWCRRMRALRRQSERDARRPALD